jgi:hypothetical protein
VTSPNSKLLLPSNPLLSLLKLTPQSSKDTLVAFSTQLLAEPPSITPYLLSAGATTLPVDKTTGSLKTLGAPHGVKMVTSDSPSSTDLVSAVSNLPHFTQPPTCEGHFR